MHERGQREHVIHGDGQAGLDAVRDSMRSRPQPIDLRADRSRLAGELVARRRQPRLAPRAVEQGRAELSLEVGDAVAHGGLRAPERARRGGEPASVHDGKEES